MTILPKKKSSNLNRDSRTVQCSSSSASNVVERSNDQSADVVVQGSSVHHRRHYLNEVTVTEAENIVVSPSGVSLPHRKRTAMTSVSSISPSANSSATTTNSHRSKLRSTGAKIAPSSSDNKDVESSAGYNSEDEYERSANGSEYSEELERKFEEKLRKMKGYTIKKMKEDGACLFRSVADQIYGDQEMHGVVRKLCMDYMAKNADHFSAFVTEDFSTYIDRKRTESAHGNHAEIQALAEMFNRPIEVYRYTLDPINTFYTMNSSPRSEPTVPIRVTYHRNMHYNSLVDPYAATIGVGLGLPQFYPGMADKNLLTDVQRASEQDEIERAMLKDKLMATDWEATDEHIQEQIARESYLEWIRTQEKMMKENNRGESTVTRPHSKPKSPPQQTSQTSASSSSGVSSSNLTTRSGKASSSKNSNHNDNLEAAGPSHKASSHVSSRALDAPSWGVADDDDNDLLNQVLAISQQEYFDSLKKSNQNNGDANSQRSSSQQAQLETDMKS